MSEPSNLELDAQHQYQRAKAAEACVRELEARVAERDEAIRAALAVLPRRKNPDNDLQKLVNLACGLLDDLPGSIGHYELERAVVESAMEAYELGISTGKLDPQSSPLARACDNLAALRKEKE